MVYIDMLCEYSFFSTEKEIPQKPQKDHKSFYEIKTLLLFT